MTIITSAGLVNPSDSFLPFNKNGSVVTLKKISETDWLLFGDIAEGTSVGFEGPLMEVLSPALTSGYMGYAEQGSVSIAATENFGEISPSGAKVIPKGETEWVGDGGIIYILYYEPNQTLDVKFKAPAENNSYPSPFTQLSINGVTFPSIDSRSYDWDEVLIRYAGVSESPFVEGKNTVVFT